MNRSQQGIPLQRVGQNPENEEIIYPQRVGYYMKKELNREPFEVQKETYQLDKPLIREINNREGGYSFTDNGQTVTDYGRVHSHESILWNTVVLENYLKSARPRNDYKLRIFARASHLCNFFSTGADWIPSSLDFNYDEREKVLRLINRRTIVAEYGYESTMIGQHRLTGDRSENVEFGKNNIYRVMELISDDYELYYSKEIDGFDGEEPIEIRGVRENKELNPYKILYKSAASADVKKIVAMIEDKAGRVQRVTIIDDFTRHDTSYVTVKISLFREMNAFFREYIPILKKFKKGKLSKVNNVVIIQSDRVAVPEPRHLSIIRDENLNRQLWQLLNFNLNQGRVASARNFVNRYSHKLFLCLKTPQRVEEELQKLGTDSILGCFVQYRNLQSARKDFLMAANYWRKIIHSVDPDLLHPAPLRESRTCAFSPYFHGLPRNFVSNDAFWTIAANKNLLFAEKIENIDKLLDNLSQPLPDFPHRIPMTVYTQEDSIEGCQEVLTNFFGNRITFEEPSPDERIIYCKIITVPAENYRTTVFEVLNLREVFRGQKPGADLYLISRENMITGKWSNKYDLLLLENFAELDPIRKFPKTVILFSAKKEERGRVAEILKRSHRIEDRYPEFVLFKAIE